MGRLEEQDFDDKRLARRNRRKRSQLFAFIILAVVLVLIVTGIGVSVHFIRKAVTDRQVQSEKAQEAASEEASQNFVIETPAEPTPEELEMSENDVMNEIVNGVISEMTLEDKVAGLFFVNPEQFTGVATVVKAGSSTQEALSKYAVGGMLYSAKNLKSKDQTMEMLKTTVEMSKYPLFMATTEEGQQNSSVTASIGGIEAVDVNSSDAAYIMGSNIASALFLYGFNFDIAPKLDVTENGYYGTDTDVAKDLTAAMARGLEESGITACLHDFPLSADTTSGTATNDISSDDLITVIYDIYNNAFANGEAKAVMMSNVSLPQVIGDNTPASLSEKIITEDLRGTLGFDGVVLTGPMNERAITESYSSDQAAVAAIKAGADMIYIPEDFEVAYQGLLSAVQSGEISEERINESLARIFRIKYAARAEQIAEN
ncbi:MAG: beta-N-acetylhexosaminidase [Butyrivibrio sp.]|nr:beta-N-acetylhexosaminidase [Butyrivibrio sp.]